MTREEIRKFLANTKMYVNGKSKEIQEKLFSFGYKWSYSKENVSNEDYPFIFIHADNRIYRGNNMQFFSYHSNREITAEEILSIEITEPSYRPFRDKKECWNEMQKHQPFGWLYYKVHNCYAPIRVNIEDNVEFESFFDFYTFADGTPFGIKKE